MQKKIDPVISGRMIAVSQNGVVKKVRERREGPVKTALPVGPPISVVDNQSDVVGCRRLDARISQEQHLVI
jgi:hypothetical protein